jgi:DNA invertase Pin-like site-specific DNA recombinase
MKAFGYLRVSGRAQVDGDGFPRQHLAIEKHAAESGLEIVAWFEEKAVKGATEWEDRPAWSDMVAQLNGVRTIMIERLDRLARDLMVQEHILKDLAGRGVTLISTEEPDLASTDPSRVVIRQIMGAIAQYDKAMIVLKLRGARRRAKASKGHCEGQKPFGHYPGEAEVLEEIRMAAKGGESAAAVARWLNANGRKTRGGGKWHPFTVSRIFKKLS